MMDSSTHCCAKVRPDRLRLALWALLCTVLVFVRPAAAQGIVVRSAEIVQRDQQIVLNATHVITLGRVVEEALDRGVPLNFVTEFELEYPRWYFLNLWNKTLVRWRNEHKLSYNVLTRQYRLSVGSLHQNFDSLKEALAIIGSTRNRVITVSSPLLTGEVHIAGIRLSLDTSQLPKPLQIDALGSRDWNLTSDWYRWTFKP